MNKIISIVMLAFLGSCGANYSIPAGDNTSANLSKNSNQNLVTFKVNGVEVRTTGWTISRFVWESNAAILMNVTSNMHDDKRTINVNLAGSVPGKYPLSESVSANTKSYGSYYPDYIGDMTNSYSFTSGSFNLTQVDTVKNLVNGNFYGTVKSIKGDSFDITDGKIINGLLKPGITYY